MTPEEVELVRIEQKINEVSGASVVAIEFLQSLIDSGVFTPEQNAELEENTLKFRAILDQALVNAALIARLRYGDGSPEEL